MRLSPIQPWKIESKDTAVVDKKSTGISFQEVFKKAIGEVNKLQVDADKKAIDFSYGNPNVDIHDVMISMEKAHLALQLTIEIRNKLVESYQEVMRMQV
ncbi:MAG: flagellar hook-basal body complex protein FliE [Clostridia bacterium]|jgi:flagellar hook-basal body complex protein FliE|nr:flagellar hook-basal body complex protein FliE [Clostridia bacterium]MDN5322926.1 flagellar hook-basal body complex protein FliE [Clostridia bacterium]